MCLVGSNFLRGKQQILGDGKATEGDQACRSNRDAKRSAGEAQAQVRATDAQIAGDGDLSTATDAGAVTGGDRGLGKSDELVAFPKPTVAACHGACVGGGAEIAVACDLRVGGSNLRLRFPGAALGVPVGPARLVTLCGLSVAKYLLLTSKEIAADEAHRWGLVHKVVAAPRTEEAALQLAAQVAVHPPEAVARLKRMLHEWDDVEGRSRVEGEGQVEWQRSGPGLPYGD